MKSLKTALIMIVLLFSVSLSLKAAEDFDILDMLPAITGKGKCNFSGLESTFKNYAVTAAALVNPADKILVANFVSQYPEGGEPLKLVDNAQGGYDTVIPSRAAAFYQAGVQAVTQQNRVVAFWCFTEAASRNAHSAMFLNNSAFALIEFGYLDDALKALQCANSLAPKFVSPYINLGKALGLKGRWAEAAENYNTGFQKFANNPHYLWRAANAYKNAGNIPKAWNLGNIGSQFGSQFGYNPYDWAAFITSLNYQPPTHQSGCGEWCFECAIDPKCTAVETQIKQYRDERDSARVNYEVNVHAPSIELHFSNFENQVMPYRVILGSCYNAHYQPATCCEYQYDLALLPIRLSADKEWWLHINQNHHELYVSTAKNFVSKAMLAYQAALPSLSAVQAGYLFCLIDSNDDTDKWLKYLNDNYFGYVSDVQWSQSAPIASLKRCINDSYANNPTPDPVKYHHDLSNAGYVEWATTGHTTTSLEPQFCLTAFCFSYDAVSGDYGFEVGAGFAGKVTYNRFTGDTSVNLGVGLNLGAGFSSAGGHAWVRMSQQEMGVEAKVNMGAAEVGYFYGHEHL